MPQKRILFEGKEYIVPDDATLEEIAQAVGASAPSSMPDFSNVQSGASTTAYTPPGPTAGDVAKQQALTALGGIPKAITQIPGAVMGAGSLIKTALTGTMPERIEAGLGALQGMGQMAQPFITATKGGYELAAGALPPSLQNPVRANAELMIPSINAAPPPGSPEWTQAAEGGGTMLGDALLGAATQKAFQYVNRFADATPSSAKLEAVKAQVKDVPLNLAKADDAALRALELAGRGGKSTTKVIGRGNRMAKVFKDYIDTREASPVMTYEQGFDFASAAKKLTPAESKVLKGPMKAQAAKFASALNESLKEAAATKGMDDLYTQGMKEYAKAMRQKAIAEALRKSGKRIIPPLLIGAGAAKVMTDLSK